MRGSAAPVPPALVGDPERIPAPSLDWYHDGRYRRRGRIGLTLVAVGTSLPELATSLMAALRKQTDIAVGNVIGSNIFNLAGVLGVAGLVRPIPVGEGVLRVEYPAVLILSVLVLLVPYLCRREGQFRIRRLGGLILLGGYVGIGFWVLA